MSSSASTQEIVQQHTASASADAVFKALVHRFTDGMNAGPEMPMPLVMELKPGGRWYRDLGNDTGHLWAFIQSVKPGSLLEMNGPLWMSGPVSNHLIIRIKEEEGTTTILFKHTAHGFIDPSFMEHTEEGWQEMFEDICKTASS